MTREQVVANISYLDLEWGDEGDAGDLVVLLSEVMSPLLIWTWLTFWCERLEATPLALLETGCRREVFVEARRLVAERSIA